MLSKNQLIIISVVLAIFFHFIFYFRLYGPINPLAFGSLIFILALLSASIMIFIYLATYWRNDIKNSFALRVFDLLVLWIFICFARSLLEMRQVSDMIPFLFYNYNGISLFPVLFFIVGLRANYFRSVNQILFSYIIVSTIISLFFLNYFELQIFLLMPIFYIILTIPLRSSWEKIFIIFISISIVVVSITNRAGILRILVSYSILLAVYLMQSLKVSKRLIQLLVVLVLMIPLVSLYMGIRGKSVFQIVLGEDDQPYSQLNPYADTRTFLYHEVFQDLKINRAFVFGKGLNATYESEAFQTFERPMVEVGFLQILMKTGIVGVLLYLLTIISAIFRALGRSNSHYLKSLGLLLSGYVIMLFLENIIAYNLLNVVIWIVVGMCHSKDLRSLNDREMKLLLSKT